MAVRKDFRLLKYEHIIYHFKARDFAKIRAKTDLAKFLKVFMKSRNLNIFQKQFISRLRASKLHIICSYLKSLNFFSDSDSGGPGGVISRKVLIKSRNHKIFQKFKLNRNLQRITFKMMYNMFMLRHHFSNER